MLEYFALGETHPIILEAIMRRRDVPRHLLVDLAARLTPDLQESLLLRQDAIIEEPEILSSLESNPELSVYARRRIGEYREHLLPRERPAEPAGYSDLQRIELAPEDIAAIENISFATVTFHLNNARKALDVGTLPHATALATKLKLI